MKVFRTAVAAALLLLAVTILIPLAEASQPMQAHKRPPNATLRIEVVARDAPVAGASVQVGGQEQITGDDGVVVVAVPAGQVRVIVRLYF
jgi:hypothetical protein